MAPRALFSAPSRHLRTFISRRAGRWADPGPRGARITRGPARRPASAVRASVRASAPATSAASVLRALCFGAGYGDWRRDSSRASDRSADARGCPGTPQGFGCAARQRTRGRPYVWRTLAVPRWRRQRRAARPQRHRRGALPPPPAPRACAASHPRMIGIRRRPPRPSSPSRACRRGGAHKARSRERAQRRDVGRTSASPRAGARPADGPCLWPYATRARRWPGWRPHRERLA